MAAATVFVDDAVQGLLPGVCAKTGEATNRRLTVHQDLTPGLGAAWVLLFFGPLGLLVLALVAATRRRTSISVKVPYSAAMLEVYATAARRAFHCAIVFGVLLVAIGGLGWGLSLWEPATTFGLMMVTFAVGALAVAGCSAYARRWLPGVGLDASGRWVTLSRVHPAFEEACRTAARARQTAIPTP